MGIKIIHKSSIVSDNVEVNGKGYVPCSACR